MRLARLWRQRHAACLGDGTLLRRMRLHGRVYGRQLILWTGAPERQLIASPEIAKPCFS